MVSSSTRNKREHIAVGLMSGTSLDGLDVVLCAFSQLDNDWSFRIIEAQTYSYSPEWKEKLSTAHLIEDEKLKILDKEYGRYLGESVNKFLKSSDVKSSIIASHGHTVFHQPEKGFTLQIGSGNELAAICNIPVVYNFRVGDVALGGQGAPLVPIGDRMLFGEYEACLNLGGFANISFEYKEERVAFDICPVNIVLNLYATKIGLEYDEDGDRARKGKVQNKLLDRLNTLSYYGQSFPKSLGREWLEKTFLPELEQEEYSVEDILATICDHAAKQIANVINEFGVRNVLVSGGGALNVYLLEVLSSYTNSKIILPQPSIINYKEALVFAFMGVLKYEGKINCLASVTGASRDSVCGILIDI